MDHALANDESLLSWLRRAGALVLLRWHPDLNISHLDGSSGSEK